MVSIKTKKDIEILREGGKRHALILNEIANRVTSGIATNELNDLANTLIAEGGDTPAFLQFKPYGAKRPYPASLCVSINDEIVHGIPNEKPKILKEGDIVSLDLGLMHNGLITDMAVTIAVGKIGKESKKLLTVTKKSLDAGIKAAKRGNHVGDIGFAVQSAILPYGFGIVRELSGHGVGHKVHEDPYVPNFGEKGKGEELVPGMVIAIEPMVNMGSEKIMLDDDGFTYRTRDGSRSAHFEHTVLITEGDAEILTKP
ncbi:MAG: type I methionyl aminopeptidase [Candidatus Taylorbacteria bacterium]